jgi:hypothetical protein
MKRNLQAILVIIVITFAKTTNAQNFGVNSPTPNASAALEVKSYPFLNQGVLIPSVALTSATDATTIPTPAATLLVYNTGTGGLTPAGYFYNAGTSGSPNWVRMLPIQGTGSTGQVPTSSGTGTPTWAGPGKLSNIVTYTSGSGTYTVPSGVTAIQVKMVGGGGAGGGAPYTSCSGKYFVGGGGGAGGYCEGLILSPAASYSYSIGTGGIGTTACATAGGSGGNTTFGSFTAGGGSGGSYNSQGTLSSTVITASGGAGGTSSGGNLNLTGASGYQGYSCSGNYYVSSGSGGSTMFGNGGPGITWYYSVYTFIKAGLNASSSALGAGGGGAISTNSSGVVAGGNGAAGIIIIYEYK